MNKPIFYTLLAAALLTHTTDLCAAAPGNRVIYGFNLGSSEWADQSTGKTYDCGFVSYPFDLSGNGTVLRSYLSTPMTGVYAGTGIDGIIYACEYQFTTSTAEPTPGDMVAYNVFSGKLEHIGPWNEAGTSFKPSDMTYDIKNSRVYAMGFFNGVSSVYDVDVKTATFTRLIDLKDQNDQPFTGGTIAADAKGQLYTIAGDGILYTIDLSTGRVDQVFNTGLVSMMQNQTMEFDHTTGKLYWASCTAGHRYGAENVWLEEIDLSDPAHITINEINNIGFQSRFVAMHIPYADALSAPAAPTAVKSEAGSEGSLTATITWTNPTTAFDGGDLGTLYGVVVKRDGQTLEYISTDVTPGKTMTYTDKSVPATGHYRYDIQAVNASGDGAKATAFQFVGPDRPGEVSGITLEPAADMQSVKISWVAPTEGFYFGSFDPSDVTYTVTRSDNTVIAENITDLSVTDDSFVRLMAYSYTVTACNSQGRTPATSGTLILGPALELPLEQTFESEAQVANRWTIVDANNDTFSWMFNTTLGQAVFGDFESCAEYISSPTLGVMDAADEWLISPPVKLEADKEYELTISARSYSSLDGIDDCDEIVDLHMGASNNTAAMTEKLGTILVSANDADPNTGTMAFVRQSVAIPVSDTERVLCFGLHLVTPKLYSGFFQTNGIFIGDKGAYNAIDNISTDLLSVRVEGRTLIVNADSVDGAVYSLQGVKVADISAATTDLSSLPAGIYITEANGQVSKIVLR